MPAATIDIPSLRDRVSPAEWQARCDLAAAYRLVALFDSSGFLIRNQPQPSGWCDEAAAEFGRQR